MNTIELKHTPGPWKATHNGSYFEINEVMQPSGKYYNMSISVYHSEPGDQTEHCRPNREQAEANAKLIAASPLLLSALIKAIELRDLWGAPTDTSNIHECYSGEMQALQQMEDIFRSALDAAGVTITDNETTTTQS